jgi:hypothetical protein
MYELRHTFATRLSAGGVADYFVTDAAAGRRGRVQTLQPSKLNMMREALAKLDRKANERAETFATADYFVTDAAAGRRRRVVHREVAEAGPFQSSGPGPCARS